MIFVIDINDESQIHFGKVDDIFIVEDNNIYLLFQPFTTLYFDEHYMAYCVELRSIYVLKNIKELPNFHACTSVKKKDLSFVVTKHTL